MVACYHVVDDHIVSIRVYYDPRPILEGMSKAAPSSSSRYLHQATISVAVRDSKGKLVMESILETKASTILENRQKFDLSQRLEHVTKLEL